MRIGIVAMDGMDINVDEYVPENTGSIVFSDRGKMSERIEQYADKNVLPKLKIRTKPEQSEQEIHELVLQACKEAVIIWDEPTQKALQLVEYAKSIDKNANLYVLT